MGEAALMMFPHLQNGDVGQAKSLRRRLRLETVTARRTTHRASSSMDRSGLPAATEVDPGCRSRPGAMVAAEVKVPLGNRDLPDAMQRKDGRRAHVVKQNRK